MQQPMRYQVKLVHNPPQERYVLEMIPPAYCAPLCTLPSGDHGANENYQLSKLKLGIDSTSYSLEISFAGASEGAPSLTCTLATTKCTGFEDVRILPC